MGEKEGKKKKKREAVGTTGPESQGGEEGGETERRGSGGQAAPANQRRARSCRSRSRERARRSGEPSPGLWEDGAAPLLCLSPGKVPSASPALSSFPPLRASPPR